MYFFKVAMLKVLVDRHVECITWSPCWMYHFKVAMLDVLVISILNIFLDHHVDFIGLRPPYWVHYYVKLKKIKFFFYYKIL